MTLHQLQCTSIPLARALYYLSFVGGLIVFCTGCTRNPYGPGYVNLQTPQSGFPAGSPALGPQPPMAGPQSVLAQSQNSPQVIEAQRRMQQLDNDNRQLLSQVAQLQQQNQALQQQKQTSDQRSELYAKQLQDLAAQNKQLLADGQQYASQARSMQASMNSRGGARLTANNSLRSPARAGSFQIAGATIVPDGNLIRIRIPSDQLFAPGATQIQPSGTSLLDQVASALVQQYSRQRVSIEGHTDTGQSYQVTPYKLAGDQAQAVLDQLVRRNRVPTQQLFAVAHGPNHPIADNQSPAGRAENRRIEVVIYPDTF